VLDAERWGDELLQPLTRRIVWGALKRHPAAIPSYQEASQLPPLPRPVVRLVAPGVIAIERALHHASDDAVRADMAALPGHLDRIDGWLGDGVLGPDVPNAADLQIAATSRLMLTIGDVRPFFAGRPAGEHALALFGDWAGTTPQGAFPAEWLERQAA
jgi:glutathione S-transferase